MNFRKAAILLCRGQGEVRDGFGEEMIQDLDFIGQETYEGP